MEKLEKQRILKMHEHLRSLMFEQTTTIANSDPKLQYLRDAISAGCLSNGRLKQDPTYDPNKRYFYRATTKSGKEVEFYADMTYAFTDGSRQGTWQCDIEGFKQKKAEEERKSNEQKTAATKDIQRTKEQGNWKERKEIEDTDANVENPQMYDKTVVKGVALYRRKGTGVAGGLNQEQKNLIKKYQDQGFKLKKDLDLTEKNWTSVVVSPASDGVFPEDLKMYQNPVFNKDEKGKVSAQGFKDIIKNQSIDRDSCRENIEAYWTAYKMNVKPTSDVLDATKQVVMACRDQHRGKWGILGGGKKWDSILDLLSNKIQVYDGRRAPRNTPQANWSLD